MKTQDQLRSEIKARLNALGREERFERSRIVAEKILKHEVYQKAGSVHCYMSMPTEVDTEFLIDQALNSGKRVLLPFADLGSKEMRWYEIKNRKTDLKRSNLGILEPSEAIAKRCTAPPEFILVPGLVFDKENNRIGRGAGFYDRYLSGLQPNVWKAGLAFSFQVFDRIPVNAHDVPLNEVITD